MTGLCADTHGWKLKYEAVRWWRTVSIRPSVVLQPSFNLMETTGVAVQQAFIFVV